MRRILTTLAAILALTLAGTVVVAAPAGATDAGDAQWFVDQINAHRRSVGVAPLTVDAPLSASAVAWTQHQAATQTLEHDGNLAGAVCCWSALGENVGKGPTREAVWAAFLASPVHLKNIEDPDFTHVGVGVVWDANGVLWTTHRFMRLATVSAPAPVAAPPPTQVVVVPRPTPVAPPTTIAPAPTTTTTAPPPPPPAPAAPEPAPSPTRVATMLDALHALHAFSTAG